MEIINETNTYRHLTCANNNAARMHGFKSAPSSFLIEDIIVSMAA